LIFLCNFISILFSSIYFILVPVPILSSIVKQHLSKAAREKQEKEKKKAKKVAYLIFMILSDVSFHTFLLF
jgi:hypothetical protein